MAAIIGHMNTLRITNGRVIDPSQNLDQVTVSFWGSPLDDPTVFVEGPADLKAKVEEALRKP